MASVNAVIRVYPIVKVPIATHATGVIDAIPCDCLVTSTLTADSTIEFEVIKYHRYRARRKKQEKWKRKAAIVHLDIMGS